MEITYKVKVTETVTRTIALEVTAESASDAGAKAIQKARGIQPAHWDYAWKAPATSICEVLSSR